jgi:hypothetical protein
MRSIFVTAVVVVAGAMALGRAQTYTDGGPVVGIPVTIGTNSFNETDPHVSGSLVSYTADPGGRSEIRYYDLATGTTVTIPKAPDDSDLLPDVSGARIVYTRYTPVLPSGNDGSNIVLHDTATGATTFILPDPLPEQSNAAIGGNIIVFEDTRTGSRELQVHDISSGVTTLLTSGGNNMGADISPSGDVIVWSLCTLGTSQSCQVQEAVRTAGVWTTRTVAASDGPFFGTATDGSIVAYVRDGDVRWQPVGGGAEGTVALGGADQAPSVADGSILFEHQTADGASDILLYDTRTNVLRHVTDTPGRQETLSDVAVRPDGSLAIVWTSPSPAFTSFDLFALVTPPRDSDADSVPDVTDNCPTVANTNQADSDGDGIGDSCDPLSGTPQQALGNLDSQVRALGLPNGIQNSLLVKLQGAQAALGSGDVAGACAKLAAFVNEVNAQSGKKIPATATAQLVAQANALRAQLGCS